jgi:hypothetical protein
VQWVTASFDTQTELKNFWTDCEIRRTEEDVPYGILNILMNGCQIFKGLFCIATNGVLIATYCRQNSGSQQTEIAGLQVLRIYGTIDTMYQ